MGAIEAVGITKRYGKTVALEGVSFEIDAGEAVALVGPNGAGKTTLLRILATLTRPGGGYARIDGFDGRFQASRVRRRIGYMPDAVGMADDLSVAEYLGFFAGLYGIGGKRRAATVRDLMELLDLGPWKDRPVTNLSRGMQQRVGLARTLMHDPPILLLDEPAANLDPRARIEIRGVLAELRRMGKTLLVSSHVLKELDEFCDRLLCLDRGRVLYDGRIEEVAGVVRARETLLIRVGGEWRAAAAAIEARDEVAEVEAEDGALRVVLRDGAEDDGSIARAVVESGASLRELRRETPGLEEIFVRLTRREETT